METEDGEELKASLTSGKASRNVQEMPGQKGELWPAAKPQSTLILPRGHTALEP